MSPPDLAPTEPILAARGITKRFPGVLALDHVDLEIQAGEIHAVLGQNGAGKTTLMNILFGLLQPDEGALYLREQRVRFRSPHDALARGIGMVHQTRRLVSAHTVLEVKTLLAGLQTLVRDHGVTVLLVTHKLPIVMAVSHRVTVLRSGRVVARLRTADAAEEVLVQHMIGRDIAFRTTNRSAEMGRPLLQVEQLSAFNDKGLLALRGVSFSLREGEVLGVAGVTGNGQEELAQVLAGLRPAASGRVRLDGRDVTRLSPLQRWRMGVGYVPAERIEVASIAAFSLVENTALNYHFDPAFIRRGLLDNAALEQLTRRIVTTYNVKAPSQYARARHLSGGNLQKLILGRVLSRNPRLLIAHLPTQGLDVEAAAFVRATLVEATAEGAAVLLISEDLDEILTLSDWVAPIYEGRFGAIIPRTEADAETVGAMMAGLGMKEAGVR